MQNSDYDSPSKIVRAAIIWTLIFCAGFIAVLFFVMLAAQSARAASNDCGLERNVARLLAKLERAGRITWSCADGAARARSVPWPKERPVIEAERKVMPPAGPSGLEGSPPDVTQPRPALPSKPAGATLVAYATPGDAVDAVGPGNLLTRYHEHLFIPAHRAVNMVCPNGKQLPNPLTALLTNAATRFGCQVSVVSGYRSPAHNRRVGGARHSQHMACRAVDFIVPCARKEDVFAWVKRQPKIRGAGIYKSRLIHADVRPSKRLVTWDWRRSKTRYARRYHRKHA